MGTIEKSIDVEVPVHVAYNQWTQFEEFPHFMEGVEKVNQLDDTHLHWVAEIAGQHREWDARITEQKPDERIAWAAEGDTRHAGVVTFHRIDANTTRVMLQLEYEPSGFAEKAGDVLGIVQRRTEGDMKRFKEFIESRGRETGAWRGEVDRPLP
ncbi:MAG TPA: SRPBCC family protein [Actinomycetota bacterium]|nr:SRPBCC family protein [Actinomycetota bacterium]